MEATDAEALPLLADALRAQGLRAVLPDQAASLQARVAWLRAFCAGRLAAAEAGWAGAAPNQDQPSAPAAAGVTPDQAESLPGRTQELLQRGASLPDLSDAALLPDLACWAAPVLAGARSLAQARSLDWHAALRCRSLSPTCETLPVCLGPA